MEIVEKQTLKETSSASHLQSSEPTKNMGEFYLEEVKTDFPKIEKEIKEYRKKINLLQLFEDANRLNQRGVYRLGDGPPFINGTPHHGHLLGKTIKEIQKIRAFKNDLTVLGRQGWDTHGAPTDAEVRKRLGYKTQQEFLETIGYKKHNDFTREHVVNGKTVEIWENTFDTFLLDFRKTYRTDHIDYMNHVWKVFYTIYQKGLVYNGYKHQLYSIHTGNFVSNSEAKSNTKEDVEVKTVYFKVPLVSFDDNKDTPVYLLLWTTTPWSIAGNLCVCVNAKFTYVQYKDLILEEECAKQLFGKDFNSSFIVKKYLGSELVGQKYRPPFNALYSKSMFKENGFKVVADDYVVKDSGTGLVHCAPAYGEDDRRVCLIYNIITKEMPAVDYDVIDADGYYNSTVVSDFKRLNEKFTEAEQSEFNTTIFKLQEVVIMKYLKLNNNMYKTHMVKQNLPYCDRNDAIPLIRKLCNGWFFKTGDLSDKMVSVSEKIRWYPENIKNRYNNFASASVDWNFSRNTKYGLSIPLFVSDNDQVLCVRDIDQLNHFVGGEKGKHKQIVDLHPESVYPLEFTVNNVKYKHIQQTFDCWFESGCYPWATSKSFEIST